MYIASKNKGRAFSKETHNGLQPHLGKDVLQKMSQEEKKLSY